MLVLGPQRKDSKSTRDKVNISNPKVNRGCPSLTANCTLADCVRISLGPSIQSIPLRIYHTGGFNGMPTLLTLLNVAQFFFYIDGPSNLTEMVALISMEVVVSRARLHYTRVTWRRAHVA